MKKAITTAIEIAQNNYIEFWDGNPPSWKQYLLCFSLTFIFCFFFFLFVLFVY